MEKGKEDKAIIKAKKIGGNLIVLVGKNKFILSDISDKDIKTIQTKILMYDKQPTEKRKQDIIDILDIATALEEEAKNIEKGVKKVVKKAQEKEIFDNKVKTKEKKVRTLSIIKKAKSSDESIKLLVTTTNGGMAMKGCEQIEMPDLLVRRIEEFIDKSIDIKPLINFWSLCLLNPNEIARTKLFDYLQNNGLMITPSGYFVTYRMVKTTSAAGVYTASHDNTMKYYPGTVCRIPREECDEDGSMNCSKGLHTGTPKFIGIIAEKKINTTEGETVGEGYGTGVKKVVTKEEVPDSYGTGYNKSSYREVTKEQKFSNEFGNQAIICLINPQHVVSIPDSNTRKMRSCEFYFCKLTTPEEVIDMVEKDYLLFDGDYQSFELKDLQEMLKDKILKAYIDSKTEIGAKIHNIEKQLGKSLSKDALRIGQDKISTNLDMTALKMIIKQRLVTLK